MSELLKRFTQTLHMHLNGGSKFSELHYDVLFDGKPTEIRHFRRTNGSPKYMITDDVFVFGDDRFDVRATNAVGLEQWLVDHLDAAAKNPLASLRAGGEAKP